ncbi:MAG: hypothetical protein ACREOQ_09385 [Gemmatimonadales bacterium]
MNSRQFVVARITEHVEPIERGERYEDPLAAFLNEHGLGEVTGGGSQLNANGEIEFADVELELVNLDDAITKLVQQLEAMGAPFGSSIQFAAESGREAIPFGKYEQLTIYLDGTGLPPDVYETLDFNRFYGEVDEAARREADGQARSVWTGSTETAVHLAGPKADALEQVVNAMWDTAPILQNARLVMRYSDARASSERRLPMRESSPGAA